MNPAGKRQLSMYHDLGKFPYQRTVVMVTVAHLACEGAVGVM